MGVKGRRRSRPSLGGIPPRRNRLFCGPRANRFRGARRPPRSLLCPRRPRPSCRSPASIFRAPRSLRINHFEFSMIIFVLRDPFDRLITAGSGEILRPEGKAAPNRIAHPHTAGIFFATRFLGGGAAESVSQPARLNK